MRTSQLLFIALVMLLSGCDGTQPASNRTVEAYELPPLTEAERPELLALVRGEASADGLHLDFTSDERLKQMSVGVPLAKMTMYAAVWRGTKDDQAEAVIMDGFDHLGLVWIMFLRGQDGELAKRFRDKMMIKILDRWPGTLSIPVMPKGSIPLYSDLRKTPSGYKLDPAYVAKYHVDASSPFVAQP